MTDNKVPALCASALTKSYEVKGSLFKKSKQVNALSNISFNLEEGKTLGILSESGAGKSTLAKILVGAEFPDSGMLLIDGQEVTNLPIRKRLTKHRKIRMVTQNPYSSLNPRLTIFEILDEPLRNNTNLNQKERAEKIKQVLSQVGLRSEHALRLPSMFSAGERQRIAIARALILEPVCIVADEPLSALDISVRSQILNLMLELQQELGIAFVIISYNLAVLKHMCDQILVLCNGEMVEYGDTDDVLNHPKHPYTIDLLNESTRVQSINEDNDFAKQCVYQDRCQYALEQCLCAKPYEVCFEHQIVSCFRAEELHDNNSSDQ
jgi:dipeptide transport system ATP-binding protein